ncbi:MAG: DUF2164 domain-containing protein [Candidatus Kapabacteria bacterium]|nr:DUF2164 domain-containing protein [Candidatus Kapabacteria bacterium]
MATVNLSVDDREHLRNKLSSYVQSELGVELGRFEADFFLDMIVDTFGPYFYNAGLRDAQAALLRRMDDIRNAIDELERPTT